MTYDWYRISTQGQKLLGFICKSFGIHLSMLDPTQQHGFNLSMLSMRKLCTPNRLPQVKPHIFCVVEKNTKIIT